MCKHIKNFSKVKTEKDLHTWNTSYQKWVIYSVVWQKTEYCRRKDEWTWYKLIEIIKPHQREEIITCRKWTEVLRFVAQYDILTKV